MAVQSDHYQVRSPTKSQQKSNQKGCREGLIDLHHNVVKDVEGLVVAAEDERGTHDVQGVDGKRLAGHQAVRLNLGEQNNSSNASLRCLPNRIQGLWCLLSK